MMNNMQLLNSINPTVKKVLGIIFGWIIIPVLIVFFVQVFVFQAFYVDGQSMEPSLHHNDYIFTSKIGLNIYRLTKLFNPGLPLERGEIIVFQAPGYEGLPLIKRVVGLPGERVIIKDGKVTIFNKQQPDGLTLQEPYIDTNYPTEGEIDLTISPSHVFVLGDNRSPGASLDSRIIGQINSSQIYGKALLRLLPINTITTLKNVDYKTNSK